MLKGACPAARPVIVTGGVVNSASGVSGIAPGAWTSIYGTNLATSSYALSAADLVNGYLPTSLRGTSVQIDGKAAFVYYVSPTQINVQAPDDSASGTVAVQVSTAAGSSAAAGTTLQPLLPGLFAASNYVLAVRVSDGTILNASSPARPGDTVELYGTGFGPTSAALPAGLVFSGAYQTTNTPTVAIGSSSATVLWCGQVGAGLYQINVVVPTTLSDGDYSVVTTIGGVASPLTPLIRIRSE